MLNSGMHYSLAITHAKKARESCMMAAFTIRNCYPESPIKISSIRQTIQAARQNNRILVAALKQKRQYESKE